MASELDMGSPDFEARFSALLGAKREQAAERAMADQALREFEIQAGLVTPETARVGEQAKELGPAVAKEVAGQGG